MSKAIITEQHLHDIADAIIAKGGATAPMTPAQMPAAIASIPSGGGDNWPPSDWPDYKQILASHQKDGYPYSQIMVFRSSGPSEEVYIRGGDHYLLSDGSEFDSDGVRDGVLHVWGSTGDIHTDSDGDLRWVISYNSISDVFFNSYGERHYGKNHVLQDLVHYAPPGSFTKLYAQNSFYFIYAIEGGIFYSTGFYFFNCGYFLKSFAVESIHENSSALTTNALSNLTARRPLIKDHSSTRLFLQRVFDEVKTAADSFNSCYSLQRVPDVLDLSSCTSTASMFYNCISLTELPTHVTAIRGLSFSNSSGVSRDSVATFDGNGNVVGGFVGNLNVKPSDAGTQTMAFNSSIKALFTADEWTAVKTCLTDKGWAVTPA